MCGGNTDTTKLPPRFVLLTNVRSVSGSTWQQLARALSTLMTKTCCHRYIHGKSLATWTKKLLLACACPEHNLPVLKSHARAFPSGPCQSLWSAGGSRPFLLLLLFPLQPNILISPTLHPVNGDEEARSMDAMICYF